METKDRNHLSDWYCLCPRPKFHVLFKACIVLKNSDKDSELFMLTKACKRFPIQTHLSM